MKNILVTGGCGYIGSHTVLSLLENGYFVYVLDSNVNSNPVVIKRLIEIISQKDKSKIKNLQFLEGDIRRTENIESIFKTAIHNNKKINGVIHFSGLKSIKESINYPLTYWDNNVVGSINLLKTMDKYECKTIIFSSSATIYNNLGKGKIKENCSIKPINPYGRNKSTIELFLNDIYESDPINWKIISLRYFNPIGAHYSGKLGENPIGLTNNIFPLILKVASKKINQIEIFGNDWDTRDGTCIRDYIHIMDLANGHIEALKFLQNNIPQILNLNIGTGSGTTVLELIKTFERVNNLKIPYAFVERRKGDMENVVADNAKILEIFDWAPKRTIEDMCRDGWKWQENNPNGYY
jgi:UDP-glucose 4-epimerase